SAGPELLPVDLYLLVDVSELTRETIPGTTTTWWTEVAKGIASFVTTPIASGYEVGLGYFPRPSADASSECRSDDYATPDVELALLQTNAGKITTSLSTAPSAVGRPTEPALEGAVKYMESRSVQPFGRTEA